MNQRGPCKRPVFILVLLLTLLAGVFRISHVTNPPAVPQDIAAPTPAAAAPAPVLPATEPEPPPALVSPAPAPLLTAPPSTAAATPAAPRTAPAPLPGLSPAAQQAANTEANTYVLPVVGFEGTPDVGDGLSTESNARLPPPELQAELDRAATRITGVRLNKIGLARLNERRAAQGLPPLVAGEDIHIAPVGMDLIVETAPETERPKSGGGSGGSASPEAEPLSGDVLTVSPKAGGAGGIVDNSTLQYFPPIRDQGSADSCVGWSEIYYATTHAVAMAYNWDAKNGGDDFRFSPMFTYNFLNEGRSQYTYFTTHFDIARHHGAVRWSEMPNSADVTKWVTDEDAYLRALESKTDGYSTIFNMSTTGIDTLKAALDNGHIAAFATFFRGWVFDTTDNDPNTTEDDAYVGLQIAHNLLNTSGGHAFVIVGYNDHIWLDLNNDGIVDPNEKGGFKVANSDGTGWRNGGYAYITYDVVRNFNTIRGDGSDTDGFVWGNRVRIAQAKPVQHQPSLVARVTLNHNKRNQVKVQHGTSTTSSTTPTSLLTTKIITDSPYTSVYQGGALAFSGAAAAYEDFTYYLDFTDAGLTPGITGRFHVQGTDSGSNDGNLTIQNVDLYYFHNGEYRLVGTSENTPAVANGSTANVWVDWTIGEIKPLITLTATDAGAAEQDQDPGIWTLTRDGDPADPLTVFFSLTGSATEGADYTLSPSGSITFASGESSATVTLTPVDDSVFSEIESAGLLITPDPAYIAPPDAVFIDILDNDNNPPEVTAGPDQVVALDPSAAWTPASLAPTAWYDASDADTLTLTGSSVTAWADKSTNGLDLAQANSAAQPQVGVNTINGMTTVKFDGSNDTLTTASNPFTTIADAFVIAVHRHDASANATLFNLSGSSGSADRWQAHAPYGTTMYFDAGSTNNRISAPYGVNVGDEILVSFYGSVTEGVMQAFKNGTLLRSGTNPGSVTTPPGNIYVGSGANTQYQNTSIAEMIILNGTVSAEDRQLLEGYLAHKWGQAGNLPVDHPHKDLAPGGGGAVVTLAGTVTDPDGSPTTLWSKISGPGTVLFADAAAVSTTATFTEPGTYVLRLTADDGFTPVTSDLTVTVTQNTDSNSNGIDDAWETANFGGSLIDGAGDENSNGVPDYFDYLHGWTLDNPDNTGGIIQMPPAAEGSNPTVTWVLHENFALGTDVEVRVSTDLVQWDPLPPEHYTHTTETAEGMTRHDLEITHDYEGALFLRLQKP